MAQGERLAFYALHRLLLSGWYKNDTVFGLEEGLDSVSQPPGHDCLVVVLLLYNFVFLEPRVMLLPVTVLLTWLFEDAVGTLADQWLADYPEAGKLIEFIDAVLVVFVGLSFFRRVGDVISNDCVANLLGDVLADHTDHFQRYVVLRLIGNPPLIDDLLDFDTVLGQLG